MATPLNISIDGKSILKEVHSCSISHNYGDSCKAVTLNLTGMDSFSLCDPVTNFGTLRLRVSIGGLSYDFLAEERDSDVVIAGVAYTVWGRTKQALLGTPYSRTITDTDTTSHPWQSASVSAQEIIAYVVSTYCGYSVSVDWNVADFMVMQDTFSASHQSPLDIIAALADSAGAILSANDDGSLSVDAYSVSEGSAVESYNSLDDITQLSEKIDYPSGFNAVTVYGYDSGGGGGGGGASATISIERTDEEEGPYPGTWLTYRVYYYTPTGQTLRLSTPDGVNTEDGGSAGPVPQASQYIGVGTERITESVTLIFGSGSTRYPDTSGNTAVTGSEITPIEIKSVTYSVNYKDYRIKGGVSQHPNWTGDFSFLFYFADQSASTTGSYSTTVKEEEEEEEDTSPGSQSDKCASMVVEKSEPDTVTPGNNVFVRVYGYYRPSYAYSSSGVTPSVRYIENVKKIVNEEIVFDDGVATTQYPVLVGAASGHWPSVQYSRRAINSNMIRPTFYTGSKTVMVNRWVGNDGEFASVPAKITYYSKYREYVVTVPGSWPSNKFKVWFTFSACEKKEVEIAVSVVTGAGSRTVTIAVKDYVSGVAVQGASIRIDGLGRGSTGSDGTLSVPNLATGDHTIVISASGYQNSEQDDLANDTFTISDDE